MSARAETHTDLASVVLATTDALIAVLDARGHVVFWNEACERTTGLMGPAVIGREFWGLVRRSDTDVVKGAIDEVRYQRSPSQIEITWPYPGGGDIQVRWSFQPLVGDHAEVTHTVATGAVVTELRRAQRTLEEHETELQTILDTLPVGVFTTRVDPRTGAFQVARANSRYTEIVGHDPAIQGPLPIEAMVHPDDVETVREAIRSAFEEKREVQIQVRIIRSDGELRWVRSRGAPVLANGDVVGGVATVVDITEQLEALEQAVSLDEIFQSSTDLVAQFDAEGRVISANRATAELLGGDPQTISDIFDGESLAVFEEEVLPTLDTKGVWRGEMTVISLEGRAVPVSQLFVRHDDPRVRAARISMVARDITETKELQRQLAHLAFHDPLTGLPNRSLLLDRLEQALERLTRSENMLAVLFLDLDYFKEINDTHGHDVGDEFLRAVAERLRATVRPSDTVARLGGDEFVVVAEPIEDRREALRIAERIRDAIAHPFTLGNLTIRSSTSIGITVTDDHAVEPGTLISRADRASYRAKQLGRNRSEQYRDEESARSRAS